MLDIGKTVLSPCKDCKDRWIDAETLENCQTACERYLRYKQQLEANREQYNEENKMARSRIIDLLKWQQRKKSIKNNKIKKQRYKTC